MANVITGIRFLCASALIFCPTFSVWFYAVYLLGGISDVLDGMVARHFGKETAFGARLDTAADVVFTAVVLVKILRAVPFPLWVLLFSVGIAGIKCFGMIMGFVLYKKFVSEHTVLNKICGILLFAIPFYLRQLPPQALTVVLILHGGVAAVAAVQESFLIRKGKTIRKTDPDPIGGQTDGSLR